jgi:GNAT superfamily N-acetyltransferase
MEVVVARLCDLPAEAFAPLIAESEREGWRFVRRLAGEWAAGTNRFDRPGEALFAAWAGGALVGVCGLNADPYAAGPAVGRVRRLYVLRAFRGRGVGGRLVQAVIQSAGPWFRSLRVRTESAAAGRLYGRLGFGPAVGVADCTHTLVLGATAEPLAPAPPSPPDAGRGQPPLVDEPQAATPVEATRQASAELGDLGKARRAAKEAVEQAARGPP